MKINYNATGARRKELAQAIGAALELKPKYMGMPSAAYQIGSFTLSKDGVLDYFESTDIEDVRKVLDAITAAGFEPAEQEEEEAEAAEESAEPEESPAAADMEAVSRPEEAPAEADLDETPGDSETEEDSDEAELDETDEEAAGLTIEMSLDKVAVGTLTNILSAKGSLIKKALGVDDLRIEVKNDKVAFPWFKELPDPEETKAYTMFISLLCKLSKELKRASANETPVSNEKYAFRCFLLRLGFIGANYKAERKILLQNLSGNSSWKNGAPEKTAPAEDAAEAAAETEVAVNE